ncbi:uncharacterized protein isoform X2 [Choristoneura fumiferana]|uniref:uncharacterized protein isoform X2 n=1 Tax=Choristoneura fumiferana TaxID=7141 RepID=UPI003D15B3B1
MASSKKEIIKFEKAIESMDASEVKECLVKTLNFLNRNDFECRFSNISVAIEAFLVGLVSDNRNLKCKLFNAECEKLALDIIEALELNRDIFRWTYSYGSETLNKDLFVYKKIFSNKMKIKPVEPKKSKSISLVSQRLILSQTQDPTQLDIPTGSKIQLLNTTLRFVKTDGEGVLEYPDMPLTHAHYMCMLVNSPKSDLNVGFGFKSLYAPLFEAMEVYGLDYEFNISFAEKDGDIASMKLEKIRRNKAVVRRKVTQADCQDNSTKENPFETSSRTESLLETNSKGSNNSLNVSLNSSTSSSRSRRRRRNRLRLTDGVSAGFVSDTLHSLLAFTADPARASVRFEGLTDREAAFVRGVKTLARATSSHGSLEAPLREALAQLNSNVAKVTETCRIRVEEGHTNTKARFITLKKVPKDKPTKPLRIQFKSAGKFDSSTGEVEMATDNVESATDCTQQAAKTKDNLDKRKAKLLEAMSVPVDSDKGKRMMELMGWAGGALGVRGGGILEPILPAIELPAGAGLGHVPPPRPEARRPAEFRLALLHNIHDLLLHSDTSMLIEYELPLKKKEKSYVNNILVNLNKGEFPKVRAKEEEDVAKRLLQEMALCHDTRVKADVSQDLRQVILTKCKKTTKLKIAEASKLKEYDPSTAASGIDREVIDDEAVKRVMATITHTSCKTPVALKGRAMRMLFLKKFIDVVRGNRMEREFRFVGVMQKKLLAFLENVVTSINHRMRCSYVADEEMCLYDELMQAACKRECYLDIAFYHNTKFLLKKMSDKIVAQQNIGSSTWPNAQDTNYVDQQNIPAKMYRIVHQNVANNAIANNNDKSGDENESRNQNVPIRENNERVVADVDSRKEVTKVKCKCDNEANLLVENESLRNNLKVKDVKTKTESDIKHVNQDNIRVENIAKMQNECDIKRKDNVVNSIINAIVKQEIKTDDDTENSWSTCSEKEIDLSVCDKEIEELDKVLGEVGLGFNVRDSDPSVGPKSVSKDYSKLNAKKSKSRCQNSIVVIAPKSIDPKIHREMYKMVQTLIWDQIDKEDYAIPLLKCYGVQNGGLVYCCHDEKDVAWLKRTIKNAKLNLKMFVFADDFIEEKKSRKLAIKINSFMPLDAKKVFNMIEMYNDIDTLLWKVLSCESFDSYTIFIVEVDEISFEYISGNNFSLYMGIDKAQFSIIF